MWSIGIDIGGTGIKYAEVNLRNLSYKNRKDAVVVKTPSSRTILDVCETLKEISKNIPPNQPCGIAFPGLIENNIVIRNLTLHEEWTGVDLVSTFNETLNTSTTVLNDAAAAGCAEMIYGAGSRRGTEILVTVGTGISTAVFENGKLNPNQYFGEILVNGVPANSYVSRTARDNDKITNKEWSQRFVEYLETLSNIISFDKIILGGGISWAFNEYQNNLQPKHHVVQAELKNRAGLIGAAWLSSKTFIK